MFFPLPNRKEEKKKKKKKKTRREKNISLAFGGAAIRHLGLSTLIHNTGANSFLKI